MYNATQIFGVVLAISFSGAYIPQIIKMIRRKSSSDVSLLMLLINSLGYGSGIMYCVMLDVSGFWLYFNYTAGLLMTLISILIWICYDR